MNIFLDLRSSDLIMNKRRFIALYLQVRNFLRVKALVTSYWPTCFRCICSAFAFFIFTGRGLQRAWSLHHRILVLRIELLQKFRVPFLDLMKLTFHTVDKFIYVLEDCDEVKFHFVLSRGYF